MKKNIALLVLSLLTSACASEREVVTKISELEQRRLAVETALAERVTKVETIAETALATAQAAQKTADGKFVYDTVLTDETIRFEMATVALSARAKGRIAEIADQLKSSNRNVFIEIYGHTDSIGSADLNDLVGLRRAENVRAFFNKQGVALNRMSTISLGERAPVTSNLTEAGRASNRRVVLVMKM
jgi:peptidoglycan-associated lipoprotein